MSVDSAWVSLTRDIAQTLVGNVVKQCYYEELASFDDQGNWERLVPSREIPGAHEVEQGVVLVFEGAPPIAITWSVDGGHERLLASTRVDPQSGHAADIPQAASGLRNVSAHSDWAELIGARITDARVMESAGPETGGPDPWSLRIDFDSGASVVVCLGEIHNSELEVGADVLLVIFNPALAQRLVHSYDGSNAWGDASSL